MSRSCGERRRKRGLYDGAMRPLPAHVAIALVAVAAAGCGEERKPVPAACIKGPTPIVAALHTAPGNVALSDGTRLSECVSRTFTDAEVQSVGIAFTAAGDRLGVRARRSDAAALELGYLVGAARRGASKTNGIQLELVRRLEQTMGLDGPPPARLAAYRRGLRAGVDRG